MLLRVLILVNLEKWESAVIVGKGALRHYPENGALYLATAKAVRHHVGGGRGESVARGGPAGAHGPRLDALWHSL